MLSRSRIAPVSNVTRIMILNISVAEIQAALFFRLAKSFRADYNFVANKNAPTEVEAKCLPGSLAPHV